MHRLATFEEFPDLQIFVELNPEARWQDVAPVLDALPKELVAVRVEKISVPVGGFDIPPYVDLVPLSMGIVFGKMLLRLADDLYDSAKPKLMELYRRISSSPESAKSKAMDVGFTSETLNATFWIPTNLSDDDFDAAWTSMRAYFEELRQTEQGSVVLQFEAGGGWWVDERQTEFWREVDKKDQPPD